MSWKGAVIFGISLGLICGDGVRVGPHQRMDRYGTSRIRMRRAAWHDLCWRGETDPETAYQIGMKPLDLRLTVDGLSWDDLNWRVAEQSAGQTIVNPNHRQLKRSQGARKRK